MTRVVRVFFDGMSRAGHLANDDIVEILDHDDPLAALREQGEVIATASLDAVELLTPVEAPEIWGAGITYEQSRDARFAEAATKARDAYARAYEADRPELFMKDAGMRRTVGPGGVIGPRSDSSWSVPEPELGVVIGERGEPVAVTIGNDVTSRDIEGENMLYLPQAKIFAGACAIGPALSADHDCDAPRTIAMRIQDMDGLELFAGETTTSRMRRTPSELLSWLTRDNPVPSGSVLLTGTGLVPDPDYTMLPGHRIEITIDGIGALVNVVGPIEGER